jgi:hypothetical protein
MEKSEDEDREVARAVSALEQGGNGVGVDQDVLIWIKNSMQRFVHEERDENTLFFPSEWDKAIDSQQQANCAKSNDRRRRHRSPSTHTSCSSGQCPAI